MKIRENAIKSPPKTSATCHICKNSSLVLIDKYSAFGAMASDCRNWKVGQSLGICYKCGVVQKKIDFSYNEQIKKIYDQYCIYYQGNGAEIVVFDNVSRKGIRRSDLLVSKLQSNVNSQTKGFLLDIGCANGTFLKAFSKQNPSWQLMGMDIHGKYKDQIESIGHTEFFCGDIKEINRRFDLISLIHVLEHLCDPIAYLKILKTRLTKEGILFIQIPDYRNNLFDLLIVDHCTHFDEDAISMVLVKSGYEIIKITRNWVHKEISIVAKPCDNKILSKQAVEDQYTLNFSAVKAHMDWLENFVESARIIADMPGKFGIFGTAIAGTWLAAELGILPDFFVDEDNSRIGKEHLGRPIYHPENIPEKSNVFIALPYKTARIIKNMYHPQSYHMPPEPKIR